MVVINLSQVMVINDIVFFIYYQLIWNYIHTAIIVIMDWKWIRLNNPELPRLSLLFPFVLFLPFFILVDDAIDSLLHVWIPVFILGGGRNILIQLQVVLVLNLLSQIEYLRTAVAIILVKLLELLMFLSVYFKVSLVKLFFVISFDCPQVWH